ncbi:EamA family transporter [Bacillus sp. Marseille-P3661]|uniref:EamA family transporter n=1 Tax=Bacillus sp. Marseille-P3661 TaxID=1936234 RepID=UPI000C84F258|nr:DMT family transporter [Bacillus sp. Marseille-P3661]
MKKRRYAYTVFLGGCCFGVLSTFVKLAYAAGLSTQIVSGSQFLFGSVLLWLVFLFSKKKKLKTSEMLRLMASGIPMGLTGIFYYKSLQSLEASLAIIFLFQFIWVGSFLEWIVYKIRPSKEKVFSILICLIGSVIAAGWFAKDGLNLTWHGLIWGLLAAISFSTYIFVSSSVGRNVPSIQRSTLFSTGAALVVLVLFPPTFLFDSVDLQAIAPYGLFLAIFGVVLPPILFSFGMPHVGAGLGAILSAAELPVAVLLSSLVLAESVGIIQWGGVFLILFGIIAGNIRSFRSKSYKISS